MRSSAELAHDLTGLDTAARQHLERLLVGWGILADLSFSDLLLFVPTSDFSLPLSSGAKLGMGVPLVGLHFVILGQMRPTTNQTLLPSDKVGEVIASTEIEVVRESWERGAITQGAWPDLPGGGPARATCIPVRLHHEVIAVLARVWSPTGGRRRAALERAYLGIFENLAQMLVNGLYPFVAEEDVEDPPRVGDGVIVVDASEKVTFASPNAVSALHRMGVGSSYVGATLGSLGLDTEAVTSSFSRRMPVVEEIERPGDATVVLHSIPLIDGVTIVGGAVLVRDVTDLRRRDRLLLSKDAAIREVHHRVKNNLQTISSLLRLQSRRTEDPTAREALLEAEHRIRAIAAVHEVLAGEPRDQLRFDEIVPTLVGLARDTNISSRAIDIVVSGEVGEVGGDAATALSLVIAELLQNAVEHAFPDELERDAVVHLTFETAGSELCIGVNDNGRGFEEAFDLDRTRSLGLAIVRDLVRSQLNGTIVVKSDEAGASVRVTLPLGPPEPSLRSTR
ncbi:MAG TPA: sensor histidine kinase [Acidimicrobiales bacterium]|nr:sensor histidine kinase [Acidimicrobiales bacterium]